MTFDELIDTSRAPGKFAKFIDCYKTAQTDGHIAIQSEIPMRGLAPIMADITLLEAKDRSEIIFRLAGQTIIESLGFSPVEQNFLDFLDPSLRETSAAGHELMWEHPCGYYMVYENIYKRGHRKVMETLTLPLRKSANSKSHLFASCHVEHNFSGYEDRGGETKMVVNWQTSSFVNIGGGEPEHDLMEDVLQADEIAFSF